MSTLLALNFFYPLKQQKSFSTVVLASNGEVLRAFSNDKQQWRYPIETKQIPAHYIELLLGYEDRWFYYHFGINPFAIARAAWQNVSSQRIVSGGSTLTMQVARLLYPHQRSLKGKLQQALRALQLEWYFSKAQILNLYLNLAPFGGTLIGVQAASISYFDKPLDQLSDAEAALLAVLPQAPSRWRPDRHPKRAVLARNKVLKRMSDLSIWPQQRVNDAINEPIFAINQQAPRYAPLLARRLKKQCMDCEKITTLIDIQMQRQLETLVSDYTAQLAQGLSVAVMVMENSTGAVRSYIGSADFLDNDRFGHVDMVQAIRSPGSTLKPFLYGLAIDKGLIHSQSLLQDAPRYNKAYRPLNFSGGFNGPVSVEQALQRSLNIPAVQVLEKLEPQYFAAKLQSAGLELKGPGAKKPNISMILGGVGAKLEHLVGVYSALARSGVSIQPRLIKKNAVRNRYLMSPGAAWITWKMLAINPNKTARSQRINNLWKLAWKTGTSYGYREAWAMGASKKWSIGVWVGRPDSSASPGISGRRTAAPLLFQVYKAIGEEQALTKPDTVSQHQICWPLGTAIENVENSVANCQQKKLAWVLDETIAPTMAAGNLAQKIWLNKQGKRVTPNCATNEIEHKTVALWPLALEPWISGSQRRINLLNNTSENCPQLMLQQQSLMITSVANNSVYQFNGNHLKLQLKSMGATGLVSWYLNGEYIGARSVDHALDIVLKRAAKYQLSAVDISGNTDVISFEVQ